MSVVKRNGSSEPFDAAKLKRRVNHFTYGLDTKFVDVHELVDTVVDGSQEEMSTGKIEELLAQSAAYKACKHPDYALLAGRLAVSTLHKTTSDDFLATFKALRNFVNPRNGEEAPLVSQAAFEAAEANIERIQAAINYKRDFNYEYFGYKTLERSYLLKVERDGERVIGERPQHMLMRVALGIHFMNIDRVIETYDLLSEGWFTHATPTLFNAGTPSPQMSSCFLIAMRDDSIDGIFNTLKTCALISKTAGGIGMHVHNVRANGMHPPPPPRFSPHTHAHTHTHTGSYIRGTNGQSNGLVPMLRVFNDTARYVDQGGGKRKGSFAVYLEPWHADVFDFLQLKKNTGKEEVQTDPPFHQLPSTPAAQLHTSHIHATTTLPTEPCP